MAKEKPQRPRVGAVEWERAEPIPLETIASELRRQSEIDSAAVPSRPAIVSTQPSEESVDGDSFAGLQAEVEWLRDQNRRLKAQVDRLNEGNGPRRTSDVLSRQMEEYLQRAEKAEKARRETEAENLALRNQIKGLQLSLQRRSDEREAGGGAIAESDEVLALRHELELVRTQAAADIETLRAQLSSTAKRSARDAEREADTQALRQEVDHLRAAVQAKENALEDLADRCRTLEDAIEDRDRAMERLLNETEEARTEASPPPMVAAGDAGPRHSLEKETTQFLDHEPEGQPTVIRPGWLPVWVVALIGLSIGGVAGWWWSGAGTVDSQRSGTAARRPAGALRAGVQADRPRVVAIPAASSVVSPAGPRRPTLEPFRDAMRGGGKGPLMVPLRGGQFIMGSASSLAAANERPPHRVDLRPFAIARTETTRSEYRAFARATGRALVPEQQAGPGNLPVSDVSWDDAVAYCEWLSRQTGHGYRLPSEAEWEYAVRGGSADHYWWGRGRAEGREVCFDCGSRWDRKGPAPVASLAGNGFGLYDMAGNLSEWTQDCYHPDYRNAPADGRPWVEPHCSQRVARGGAYNKPQTSLRSAQRYGYAPATRLPFLGFRVVRER